jgi:alanyl-tRNA synthetase
VTQEQLEEVERLVNEAISKHLPISYVELHLEEAKSNGAIGVFDDKYDTTVKVYRIGDNQIYSYEIC